MTSQKSSTKPFASLTKDGLQGVEKELETMILNGQMIEKKWVTPDEKLRQFAKTYFPEETDGQKIFFERKGNRARHPVAIASIEGTEYESVTDTDNLTVYVGGPGSMVGAALNAVNAKDRNQNEKVMFVTHDFEHTNARSSAYIMHVHHSTALNSDPTCRPNVIMKEFVKRLFTSNAKTLELSKEDNYIRIDISTKEILSSSWSNIKSVAMVCAGQAWHTFYNVAYEALGLINKTDWTDTRRFSLETTPVLRYLEEAAKKLGVQSKHQDLVVGVTEDGNTPQSLRVTFDSKEAAITEHECDILEKTSGIHSKKLSKDDIGNLLGNKSNEVHAGYGYPQSGRIGTDMNKVLKGIVQKTGNTWAEGISLEKVYVDKDRVRGLLLKDTKTDKTWFQPCSNAILSLGYTADYTVEGSPGLFQNSPSVKRAPVGHMTTAAGFSSYFLIKGRVPIIDAQNAHWSEVAYNPEIDVTLGKTTGGGNIGSEFVPATYALNNIIRMKKMWQSDRLLGILSMEGCARTVNWKNDGHFYRVFPGLVISQGLGGTGMTKMGGNGALSYMLSHPEVKPSEVVPGHPQLFESVNVKKSVTDVSRRTRSRLGGLGGPIRSPIGARAAVLGVVGAITLFGLNAKNIQRVGH